MKSTINFLVLIFVLAAALLACEKDENEGVYAGGGNLSQDGLPTNFGQCKIVEENFYINNDSLAYRRHNYYYKSNGEIDYIIWSAPHPQYQYPPYDTLAFVKNQVQNIVFQIRKTPYSMPDTINAFHFDYQGQLKKIVNYSDSRILSNLTFIYGQLNKPSYYVIEYEDGSKAKVRCQWNHNNIAELRVFESNFPEAPVNLRLSLTYDNQKNPYRKGYYFNGAFWNIFNQNNVKSTAQYQPNGNVDYSQNNYLAYHSNYPISITEKHDSGDETVKLKYSCN